ncbi:hypothetical protein RB195_004816 [Necator americanus]|uniref:Acyltransferase 3 domain-containing protein n=1 Tax=Necator americanus TaxID=51031 RepID=A0ABR1BMW7_NECAM
MESDVEKSQTFNSTRSPSYRNDLQGIRAIAIISVLLFHYYPSLFPNGYVGVDQFFVLSGYLMSMMTEQEKKFGIIEIAYFYYRRAKRILPSYLLMIILSLTCSRFLFFENIQLSNKESAKYALLLTTNIQAADSVKNYETMLSKATDLFTHTWSIAVEMQFYAVFPAIMVIFKVLPVWIAMVGLKLLDSNFPDCTAPRHNPPVPIFTGQTYRANSLVHAQMLSSGQSDLKLGSLSLSCHVMLPHTVAFNFVHARVWQFILEFESPKSPYVTHLMDFLRAYSPETADEVVSCSVSLDFVARQYWSKGRSLPQPSNLGLSCGLILSILVAVLLTETFEKICMQADVRVVLCIIVSLYATNLLMIDKQKKGELLGGQLKWAEDLFTPVCSSEDMRTNCDIPFTTTKLRLAQVLRLNNFFTLWDGQLLSYKECSYRRGWQIPWGYCDLPSKSKTPVRKIMVIGNCYAANQGGIVYEMCHSSDVDVQVFSMAGEMLIKWKIMLQEMHAKVWINTHPAAGHFRNRREWEDET